MAVMTRTTHDSQRRALEPPVAYSLFARDTQVFWPSCDRSHWPRCMVVERKQSPAYRDVTLQHLILTAWIFQRKSSSALADLIKYTNIIPPTSQHQNNVYRREYCSKSVPHPCSGNALISALTEKVKGAANCTSTKPRSS